MIKRNQMGVIQRRKKFPIVSITIGKDKRMKVRAFGKFRLENPLRNG